MADERLNILLRVKEAGTAAFRRVDTGIRGIIQRARQGKLSFDDPISKYLDDDWLPEVDKTKIKVKHLLTHTSGLGSYFNEEYDRSSRELFREVDDYKPLVAGETLAFEPGTDWRYSNTGMLIAGAVIEGASGRSYFDLVREVVYGPGVHGASAAAEAQRQLSGGAGRRGAVASSPRPAPEESGRMALELSA